MKSFLECSPCILRQAVHIVSNLIKSPKRQKLILYEITKVLGKIDVTQYTPPEATEIVHRKLKKLVGTNDLYLQLKKESNLQVLKLYPSLKNTVKKAKDPLLTAIRLSIAGNIIDYGAHLEFNVEETIKKVLKQKFAKNDYVEFKNKLKKTKSILYIGDNAGEIVFDRILIEELIEYAPVTYAVKSAPVLNDVLIEDAWFVGLEKIAKIIKSGSTSAGTTWEQTTQAFKRLFRDADIVIAKGQGNLETLDQPCRDIFFLLYLKCSYLAEYNGLRKGDILFWQKK